MTLGVKGRGMPHENATVEIPVFVHVKLEDISLVIARHKAATHGVKGGMQEAHIPDRGRQRTCDVVSYFQNYSAKTQFTCHLPNSLIFIFFSGCRSCKFPRSFLRPRVVSRVYQKQQLRPKRPNQSADTGRSTNIYSFGAKSSLLIGPDRENISHVPLPQIHVPLCFRYFTMKSMFPSSGENTNSLFNRHVRGHGIYISGNMSSIVPSCAPGPLNSIPLGTREQILCPPPAR